MAKSLAGTKSHQNLKEAFAGESQANRRYLYFARVADIEGYPVSEDFLGTRRRRKPDMPSGILISLRRSAIHAPEYRSGPLKRI